MEAALKIRVSEEEKFMKRYLNLNVFVSLGIIILAVLWLRLANSMGHTGIGDTASVWGTAASVPKFLLISLIIVGVYILITELRKASKSKPAENEDSKEERKKVFYPIALMVMILVYTLVLEYFGFIICTILLTAGAMLLFGSKNIKLIVAVPVAFSVFLFVTFRYVLLINLPTFSLF